MEPWAMTATLARMRNNGGLMYRAVLSSAFTVAGFGTTQAIRLASNLILTRLLFPEAFGMMALVTVFIVGLAMFSDVGTGASIMQSKRGDDPVFLDTAWTIQIIRGLSLWCAALVLAWPVSVFYGEPGLIWYLPVAALSLVVTGFQSTRLQTAHRHLQAGRVTLIEIATQTVGVVAAVLLALWLHSVWALIFSGIIASITNLILIKLSLPGHPNRIRWDPTAAKELIHFGKWIFLATVCGFIFVQADKIIIGHYLSLAEFGLYNISVFLATFPFSLGGAVFGRLLIPVYRQSPPLASMENRARVRKMRMGALGALTVLVAMLAFGGAWLVELMYDDRYHDAAGIVVLIAILQMPTLIMLSCDQAALAAGDSRRYAGFTLARAVLMVTFLLIGLEWGGLEGAIIGQGLAGLAAYPMLVWLLRPHGAWDPVTDAVFMAIGVVICITAWQFNAEAIATLATMGRG
jgi:O-antigen/teichoic acid export membrane protein